MNKFYLFLGLTLSAFSFMGCSNDDEVVNDDKDAEKSLQASLLTEGRQWCVGSCTSWPVYGEVIACQNIWIEGSLEYQGKTYKRLKYSIRDLSSGLESEEYDMKPVREEDGKVYVLDTLSGKETLDFDCNAKVGDRDPRGYTITEIVNKIVGADDKNERKCFVMEIKDELTHEPSYHREYIEGIGYVDGAFLHDPLSTGGFYKLLCCHEAGGKCIYGEAGHVCYFNSEKGH